MMYYKYIETSVEIKICPEKHLFHFASKQALTDHPPRSYARVQRRNTSSRRFLKRGYTDQILKQVLRIYTLLYSGDRRRYSAGKSYLQDCACQSFFWPDVRRSNRNSDRYIFWPRGKKVSASYISSVQWVKGIPFWYYSVPRFFGNARILIHSVLNSFSTHTER